MRRNTQISDSNDTYPLQRDLPEARMSNTIAECSEHHELVQGRDEDEMELVWMSAEHL